MKFEARVLEVDSTLTGERVGMTIDDSALAKIMGVLTDLYSDPQLAVIREYSTNALDSHIEAGVTRPIEVTTPTSLAPFFRVRDFGLGLDADDIRNVYSRYGTSTKTNSNDVVGMLGLGCKSALTYTDQFTISGTKDGVTTQVSVTRDEDGAGSMTIVAEFETDDPNGVEIIVPAKSSNQFEFKAKHFFSFWKKGTVLLNGVEPKQVDGLRLADDLMLTTGVDRDYVVMGNVAYPMSNTVKYHNYKIVAWVNIGDVEFVPSREALQWTKKTKEAIERIQDRVQAEKMPAVERVINEAKNKEDALAVALKMNYFLGNATVVKDSFKYKGTPIPFFAEPKRVKTGKKDWQGKLIEEYDQKFITMNTAHLFLVSRAYGKGWSDNTQKIPAHVWPTTLWLEGFEGADFTAYKKQKLIQWFAKQTFTNRPERIVLCKEVPANVRAWINPATIRPYAEVAAEKIVRENVSRNDGRPTGSYKGYVDGKYNAAILAGDIDAKNPIFYVTKHQESEYDASEFISKFHKNYTVVYLGDNRIAKFTRDFPTAQSFRTVKPVLAKQWADNLTYEDRMAIHLHCIEDCAGSLMDYDPSQVDDPELAEAIRLAKIKTPAVDEFYTYRYMTKIDVKWNNPLTKYNLLSHIRYYGTMDKKVKSHVYLYLNAAYATGQENC